MELTSWVFATANCCNKIIPSLLSRFAILEVPEYTFEEFLEIAVIRLSKENVDESVATVIAETVCNELGSKEIRDVVKIGRLITNIQEVPFIVTMLKRRASKRIVASVGIYKK
jgi:ATP-dependent Lon protease